MSCSLDFGPHYLASVLQTTPKVLGGNRYGHRTKKAHAHTHLAMSSVTTEKEEPSTKF